MCTFKILRKTTIGQWQMIVKYVLVLIYNCVVVVLSGVCAVCLLIDFGMKCENL